MVKLKLTDNYGRAGTNKMADENETRFNVQIIEKYERYRINTKTVRTKT